MRKTFAESFEEELKIEEEIAKKWGYSLPIDDLQASKASEKTEKNLFINRNIIPRQIDRVKIQMSRQHKQLVKEMENNEFERQMREKADKKNQSEQFNAIKLLNERIKQYNYLIDHKHIKNKNSDDTKKVLKMKPKTEAELILEEINAKNNELVKTEDLFSQFKLNKKITMLYRQYKGKMYDDSALEQNRKKSFNQTQTMTIKDQMHRQNRAGSFAQARNRIHSTANVLNQSQVWPLSNKKEDELNIQEPFVNKAYLNKSKEMEKHIHNNHEQLEVYRFKVNQVKAQSLQKQNKIKKAKTISQSFMTPRQSPLPQQLIQAGSELPQFQKTRRESADYTAINSLKEKKKQQQKYFSSFLEKRNRKFKKPWGNKILIKYDSHLQAKQMLEGCSGNASPDITGTDFFPNSTQKISSFKLNPKEMSDDDRAVYESMLEQQADEELYEIMCKNQKVNLFLKARRKLE